MLSKVEKELSKVPAHLQGHLPSFVKLTTQEKIGYMIDPKFRKEWYEDLNFVMLYLKQTPPKAVLQTRLEALKAR